MTGTQHWQQRWDTALMANYGTPAVALASGQGAVVRDVDGRNYLDLYAGIAVNVLGHAHPAVREAVERQLGTLGHVSNLALSEPVLLLAERLKELTGHERVLFTNSGAEANEAALKIARRLRPGAGFVACDGAFHGRTLGALSVTGQPAKRAPFEPLLGPVTFVPYGDAAALDAAVHDGTASVVLEPVLGEAGVVVGGPRGGGGRGGRRPRRRVSWRRPGRPATAPARCCTWTRCRAASGGPAAGCAARCSPPACAPT